jgi:8-amino-7-oxononanoate synthase
MRREPEALRALLADIDREQRRRVLRVAGRSPRHGSAVLSELDGRLVLNFCSNDYLGLSQHPEVIAAFRQAAGEHGVGSGAAHLLGGHSVEHQALERELAEFTGRQRALLFSTGYMANLAVVCSFAGRGEVVLQDRLNHASLIDGARLSGARLVRYPHADAAAAANELQQHDNACLLATDGVFSMDGDSAPLAALAAACLEQRAWLLVDDAHGLGVVGPQGRGSVAAAGLDAQQVPLLMGTLGKAVGCFGAFVAGDHDVIEVLLQRARPYIYTTAMPPAQAAAARAALQVCEQEEWRRERLADNIAHLRRNAAQAGIALAPSATAIQPLIVGDSATALRLGEQLLAAGFLVGVTRPPTVPAGSARLRITLSAAHEPAQIDALTAALCNGLSNLPSLQQPADAAS